jgi:hypothetical protein
VKINPKTRAILTEGMGFLLEFAAGRTLTLAAVVARGKAGLFAEESREMAGVGVAHLKGDVYHALLRFAQ